MGQGAQVKAQLSLHEFDNKKNCAVCMLCAMCKWMRETFSSTQIKMQVCISILVLSDYLGSILICS